MGDKGVRRTMGTEETYSKTRGKRRYKDRRRISWIK